MWIMQELKISAMAEQKVDIYMDSDWLITSLYPRQRQKTKTIIIVAESPVSARRPRRLP